MQQVDLSKLVVSFEAQSAKYLKDLEKQRAETRKWRDQTTKQVKSVQDTFRKLGVTAAVTTATVAMRGMITESVRAARDIKRFSQVANESVQDFQAQSFAIKTVGIDMEKYADISKDARERVGDFLATGGGPLKDFFENVAPKIGLAAEELKNLSGKDVLLAVKDAMDKTNISAEEQVFYLESIASDASLLIPLLADQGSELNKLTQEYNDMNIAMSETEVEELVALSKETDKLSSRFDALTNVLTARLSPSFLGVANQVSEGLIKLVDLTKWAGEEIAATFGGVAGDDIVRIKEQIKDVQALLNDKSLLGKGNRLRFFGPDGVVKYWSDDELKAELERLQTLAEAHVLNNKLPALDGGTQAPSTDISPLKEVLNKPVTDIDFSTQDVKKEDQANKDAERDRANSLAAFERLQTSLLSEEEALQASYNRRVLIIEDALQKQVITEAVAMEQRTRLDKEMADAKIAAEEKLAQAKQAAGQKLLDASIGFAKEDSKIQQGLLIVKSVAALKQAGLNFKVALSNALAVPFPANIPLLAKVGVIGGGILSEISSIGTSLPSFMGGGILPDGPRTGGVDGVGGIEAIVHPGEIVFDPQNPDSPGLGRGQNITFNVPAVPDPEQWYVQNRNRIARDMQSVGSRI